MALNNNNNNNSNINELIGEEFDEMGFKFLSFSILDCNINLSNSIIEYYKEKLHESSKEILKELLNNEAKLNEIKMDINSMKDKVYYNEIYQIKESNRVMDNHYHYEELINIFKFLIQNLTINISNERLIKVFKVSVNRLLQHLFNLILQSSETTFKEIEDTIKLYQDNQVEIQSLEFFQIFYYLHHKSDKLSNYFLTRTKNRFNNLIYFIDNNKENIILNQYFSNHIKSYQQIKSESFQALFLKLYTLIEENQLKELEKQQKEDGDIELNELDQKEEEKEEEDKISINHDNFKFNFYFDIHYLLNINDYDTIIKLIQTIDPAKLKDLNYLGFLNSMNLDEPESFKLIKDFVKYDFFKNRLIVEHGIKILRLDLIKFTLENSGNGNSNRNKKIKRLSQDVLLSLFNISKDLSNSQNSSNSSKFKSYEIIEYLLSKHKDLVFNSLINKLSLFNKSFTNGNIKLCKLIMKYAPIYVEIKIKDIKETIANKHLEILEFFYSIGSKVLKNRISKLLRMHYKNYSKLHWLME